MFVFVVKFVRKSFSFLVNVLLYVVQSFVILDMVVSSMLELIGL